MPLCSQTARGRVASAGAAEHVDDVDLAGHVGEAPVHLLPEDLGGVRVVDGHGNDLEPHLQKRLRHIVRRLPSRGVRLDAEHGNAPRRSEQPEQLLFVVLDQVPAPVFHPRNVSTVS